MEEIRERQKVKVVDKSHRLHGRVGEVAIISPVPGGPYYWIVLSGPRQDLYRFAEGQLQPAQRGGH